MLDPNLLPVVRTLVAGIAGLFVAMFLYRFLVFWLEAKRENGTKRYRSY